MRQRLWKERERTIHDLVDDCHGQDNLLKTGVEGGAVVLLGTREDLQRARHERARVLDHGDMYKDEAGLGRGWVETLLKGADQAEVGILKSEFGVHEAIIKESVRAGILHKGLEAGATVRLVGSGMQRVIARNLHLGDLDYGQGNLAW